MGNTPQTQYPELKHETVATAPQWITADGVALRHADHVDEVLLAFRAL
jgi:hypothetical protein